MFPGRRNVLKEKDVPKEITMSSLGNLRTSHGNKLLTDVPIRTTISDGNFKNPIKKVLFSKGTFNFSWEMCFNQL